MSTLSLRKIKHDSSAVDNIALDSSGNVGINKATPRATTGFNSLSLNGTDGSEIWFDANNGAAARLSGTASETRITAQASGSVITMFTGATERLRVNNSGQVITPYQPAFDAYGTVGNFLVTTEVPIPLNSTTYNIGNHYNTSNYRFTAPVAGIYFFRAHTYKQASGNASRLRFYKNAGDVRVYQYVSSSDTYTHAITGIISLAVGDYVTCTFNSDGAGTNIYLADNHTNFSGYLLG